MFTLHKVPHRCGWPGGKGFPGEGMSTNGAVERCAAEAEHHKEKGRRGPDEIGIPALRDSSLEMHTCQIHFLCRPHSWGVSRHVQSSCRGLAGTGTRHLHPRSPCSPGLSPATEALPAEMHPQCEEAWEVQVFRLGSIWG